MEIREQSGANGTRGMKAVRKEKPRAATSDSDSDSDSDESSDEDSDDEEPDQCVLHSRLTHPADGYMFFGPPCKVE